MHWGAVLHALCSDTERAAEGPHAEAAIMWLRFSGQDFSHKTVSQFTVLQLTNKAKKKKKKLFTEVILNLIRK